MSNRKRIKSIKFHIKAGDYFITLATILDLLKQGFESDKFIFPNKNKMLKNVVNDLMYLQEKYKIAKK